MPQLNAIVENIELKTNKESSANIANAANWTDDTYPSAKALYDIAHPINSIYTTSDQYENPSDKFGGTWELIDKAFKGTFIKLDNTVDNYWTSTNTTLHNTSNALLIDHMIHLRVYVYTTVDINTDTDVVLGKLDLSKCGVTSFSSATYRHPAVSDVGNCVINYTLENNGTITIHDVLNVNGTHSVPAGMDIIFNIILPVGYDRMNSALCDKFYWKRTA